VRKREGGKESQPCDVIESVTATTTKKRMIGSKENHQKGHLILVYARGTSPVLVAGHETQC